MDTSKLAPGRTAASGATDQSRQSRHQRTLLLYLSGSIQKGQGDGRSGDSFWSEEDERILSGGVASAEVKLLNPAKSVLSRSDYYANFGCDLHLIRIADAVVVDARTKKGVGIGAEMMFAQTVGVPVITVCPQTSPYRREQVLGLCGQDVEHWVHPFIYGLSDFIVEGVDEAAELIDAVGDEGLQRRPNSKVWDAIEYFNRARETFERSA